MLFLDEVQQFFGEIEFRQAMEAFRNVTRFGIPCVAMTGSLHEDLVQSMASFFGFGEEGRYIRRSFANPVPGIPFWLQVENSSEQVIKAAVDFGLRRFTTNKQHVHFVCDSKSTVAKIAELLVDAGQSSLTVTSETPKNRLTKIASKWYQGKSSLTRSEQDRIYIGYIRVGLRY